MAAEGATDGAPDGAIAAMENPVKLGSAMSVPQTATITVNHDNVLQAAKIIQDLLDNEGQDIQSQLTLLSVAPPGADVVSVQSAGAWNARLVTDPDSYSARVNEYLRTLQTLVNNLRTAAKQYGYTDEQIATAFGQAGGGGA